MTTNQQTARDTQHTDRLEGIAQRRTDLDSEQFGAVLEARLAGVSWARIGAALGVSAQAVQQRYSTISATPVDNQSVRAMIEQDRAR